MKLHDKFPIPIQMWISLSQNESKKSLVSQDDKAASEHFFFHDIINHTHGILLYLNQKEVVAI